MDAQIVRIVIIVNKDAQIIYPVKIANIDKVY